MQLPTEYLVDFHVIKESTGYYDGSTGKYVNGDVVREPAKGIILPLSNDDLQYGEGGTYTVHDRKVYISSPLEIGQSIEYKDKKYIIRAEKDYGDLAEVYIYFVRRMGESSD